MFGFGKTKKEIIGRLEKVDIPTFNLKSIEAKMDTGAYNGAIHTSFVEEFEKDGVPYIRFKVLDEEHPEFSDEIHETSDFEKKTVKNSVGNSEERYIVPVTVCIKGKKIKAKLGLSNREGMRKPVLLGRRIFKRHFIIDAGKKFIN